MRTTSRVRASTRTGASTFDSHHDYDFLGRETPVDRTQLNVEDVLNLDLGAVLQSWDDTLSTGCIHDVPWRPREVADHLYVVDHGTDPGADLGGKVVPQLVSTHVRELYRSTLGKLRHATRPANIDALDSTPGTATDADPRPVSGVLAEYFSDDITRPVCRLHVGPVTAATTYKLGLWVLLTGDEVGHVAALGLPSTAGVSVDLITAALDPDAPARPELLDLPERLALDVRPDEQSALEVIAALQDLLELPAASVLRASGIRRRTYQNWKATGATPRLSSQARLWDLALSVRGWADVLGEDLAAWIRHPDRLKLLDAGQLGDLSTLVLNHQARQVADVWQYRDQLTAGHLEDRDTNPDVEADADDASGMTQPVADDRAVQQVRRARRAKPTDDSRRLTT